MKRCPKCAATKPLEEFNKAKNRKDGHQTYCRSCQRTIDSAFYRKHEHRRQTLRERANKKYDEIRAAVVAAKQGKTCSSCPEDTSEILHFHHVGPKRFEISNAANRQVSLKALQAEIDNCILLCPNCHAKLHLGEKAIG